jgi:murein DD-endopeptidase MepM/ murein hydrolase activator NlpD
MEESPLRKGFRLPLDDFIAISQGYFGPYSHFAFKKKHTIKDQRYCVDFVVPPGSVVRASQKGEVFSIIDGFSDYYDGYDMELGSHFCGNLLVLQHAQDCFTIYSHLEKNSFLVSLGDCVAKGQPIVKTGLVGWIGKFPHLHFQAVNSISSNYRSFPVEFEDYNVGLEHSKIYN